MISGKTRFFLFSQDVQYVSEAPSDCSPGTSIVDGQLWLLPRCRVPKIDLHIHHKLVEDMRRFFLDISAQYLIL
jgi:hypothetical protein